MVCNFGTHICFFLHASGGVTIGSLSSRNHAFSEFPRLYFAVFLTKTFLHTIWHFANLINCLPGGFSLSCLRWHVSDLVLCVFHVNLKKFMHFTSQLYTACSRVSYCTPVWHYAITRTRTEQIESIQKRAIRIIFQFTREISYPYPYALFAANLNSLHSRRHDISKSFFQDICDPSSSIHHLLPPTRDTSVLSRLRTVTPLPRLSFRTKKLCSFIIYASNNYPESTKLTRNSSLPTESSFFSYYRGLYFCFNMLLLCSVFIYSTVAGLKCEISLIIIVTDIPILSQKRTCVVNNNKCTNYHLLFFLFKLCRVHTRDACALHAGCLQDACSLLRPAASCIPSYAGCIRA